MIVQIQQIMAPGPYKERIEEFTDAPMVVGLALVSLAKNVVEAERCPYGHREVGTRAGLNWDKPLSLKVRIHAVTLAFAEPHSGVLRSLHFCAKWPRAESSTGQYENAESICRQRGLPRPLLVHQSSVLLQQSRSLTQELIQYQS